MKPLIAVLTALVLSACAATGGTLGPTPEAQIVNGNNVVNTAVTLTTVTLRRDAITVKTAESYRAILKTAANHIADADVRLTACRKRTGSTPRTAPDPCVASIGDDIELGLKIAGDVKATLEKK